ILYRDNVYEVKDSVISNDKVFISADELLEIQKPVLWAEIKIDVINPQIKLTVNKYCEPKWENQSPVFKNGELYIPLEPILTSLGLTMDYSADTLNIYRQGDLVYSMSTNSYVPDDENNTAYMNVNQLDSIKTNILWAEIDIDVDNSGVLPKSLILDIPIIPMLPDYPTGCEFRSVEMMLAGIGISIDIENLINDTPVNNDPRLGIRGDPRFPLDDPQRRYAYWIYPPAMIEPIESAAPVTAVDLTGISLSELKSQIAKYKVGVCVHMGRWNDDFVYHDVLVVGYDSNYIYINDSYSATQMKFTYQKFTELWEVTEADRDSIPYYTKDRALSLITTDEQMKKAKYEIVY
ncbi:MAG: C39 family peptidase, partial [Oscillospiraceae bacterium]|nr:C39 family peptidase [Oscillospiraceae bacterium]